ncbi:hypothetical protein PSI19_12415 [Xenorhabdus khoisanae]|uniref:hypothetical protein n=1 Tax=Xenorhabdus khoisanae TaxID=880157 RepID=UPI002359929A|nr:hypothetical protein [Xenorhabdus khoisanae]MDC9614653.1 hypothetical protein [Xenorhabdus khoisanae]
MTDNKKQVNNHKKNHILKKECGFYKKESFNYTQWISSCVAAARERIPGSIDNYVTGVSECSQQRGNLKDEGYIFN